MAAKRKTKARASARKAPRTVAGRKAAPKGVAVLGVDVEAYGRQLLRESGGDVRKAHDALEAALTHLRDHLHAYMEVKMTTVRLPP